MLENGPAVLARLEPQGDESPLRVEDSERLIAAITKATSERIPFVGVFQTTGVDPNQGMEGVDAWARVARALTKASGVVPTALIVSGPVISGPALLLGLSDLTVFTADVHAYVSGPKNIEAYTGVPVSASELGGEGTHQRSTGLATAVVGDVDDALDYVGAVLSYLPSSVEQIPPTVATDDNPNRPTPEAGALLPDSPTGSYDVRSIVRCLVDDEEFVELRSLWAPNLVTGFASIGGQPIGVVANQTQALAGSIDIPAAQKGARFVAFCDAFNVGLLTLVDTSGFLPGKDLEWRGMIRHGAQMAFAYARATVPRVGLILRKSYGGAYIVMDSTNMGNDLMLSWPSAEVAVMGASGAVEIMHRKATQEERTALQAEYEAVYLTPYPAAERTSINSVITPADTRRELASTFAMLASKREKLQNRHHDNSPL